jgi:hypothetical protein
MRASNERDDNLQTRECLHIITSYNVNVSSQISFISKYDVIRTKSSVRVCEPKLSGYALWLQLVAKNECNV